MDRLAVITSFCLLGLATAKEACAKDIETERKIEELVSAIVYQDTKKLHSVRDVVGDSKIFVNDKESTLLMLAVMADADLSIESLLLAGADINEREDEQGQTALHLAVFLKSQIPFDVLTRWGANLEAEDLKKATPLMYAIKSQDSYWMGQLVKAGANPNGVTSIGMTPLIFATTLHLHNSMWHLVKRFGADVNFHEGTAEGFTALMQAASTGDFASVDTLLELGADPNVMAETGVTALLVAIEAGSAKVVKALIQAGADIEQPLKNTEHSPLMHAIKKRDMTMVSVLLEAGADPFAVRGESSALEFSYRSGFLLGFFKIIQHQYGIYAIPVITSGVALRLFRQKLVAFAHKQLGYRKPRLLPKNPTQAAIAPFSLAKKPNMRPPARPFFSGGSGDGAIMRYTSDEAQRLAEASVAALEADYAERSLRPATQTIEAAAESSRRRDDSRVQRNINEPSRRPAEVRGARRPDLPSSPTELNLFLTDQFRKAQQRLSPAAYQVVANRIRMIIEEHDYGDLRHISEPLLFTLEDQSRVFLPLYELRFTNGMRIYIASPDKKNLYFLLIGDKQTQTRDIAYLGGK